MSWGRIDDRLDDSPKFAGIDPAAAGLWLLCQPQALRRGDGFVPEGVPQRFIKRNASRIVAMLVLRGLWDEVDGGWLYHDFATYSKLRDTRSEAGGKGAKARWQTDGKPMAKDASRDGKEYPVPVPVPRVAKATTPKPPAGVESAVKDFTETWNAHSAPLPSLRKPPQGEPKLRLVRQAVAYFDGDMGQLGAAIRRCASDEHYRASGYGFEAFCRHVERWGEAPALRVVGRDDKYADVPRNAPGALSLAFQQMDRAHTDEEKTLARQAILAAQSAAGMAAHG